MGKRLGAVNDVRDIKNHAFFAAIDWVALDKKEISPPYNPNTVSSQLPNQHPRIIFFRIYNFANH